MRYTKRIDALNAIIDCIGGDSQTSELAAWQEIESIGLVTAPVFVSSECSTDGLSVDVTFDKDMADPAGKHAQFAISDRTISAAALKSGDDKTIRLTLTLPLVDIESYLLSYTKGTIQSSEGELLESFSDESITNNSEIITEQYNYQVETERIGASLIDKEYCFDEIAKAVDDGYFDKIAFWVDNDFGKKTGTGLVVPYIVFNHDDGKTQDWDTYQSFVAAGSGRGTSYINGNFIGTSGYLTAGQVATMAADGWDFQCHTWSHARSDALGGDVPVALGLTGCTDEQVHEELQKNNEVFAALGLPEPKHLAYPNYLTEHDRVTPIVAQYRETMRVGSSSAYSRLYGNSLVECSWRGHASCYFSDVDLASNKALVDQAILQNDLCIFEGHGTTEPYFSELLAYIYSKGLTPHTVSEMWDHIRSVRNKLVNVAKGNYEALVYLDTAIQTEAQGIIVFNDTFENIGATIADYYKDKGYHVAFWDDDSDAALAYLYKGSTPFHNATAVTVTPADDRLTFASAHGLITNHKVYLTGDAAPAGSTLDIDYFCNRVNDTQIRLSDGVGGSAINLTDAGTNVKVNTRTQFEAMKSIFSSKLKKVKTITNEDSDDFNAQYHPFNVNMSETFVKYMQWYYGTDTLDLQYSKLTGTIPIEMRTTSQLLMCQLQYNSLTGGLANLLGNRKMTTLRVYYNSFNEDLPSNIGDLYLLTSFEIMFNTFTGSIPRSIGKMTALVTFSIYNNLLSGAIPVELGQCIAMQRIRAYNNSFTDYEAGAISTGMTSLIEVRFDGCALSSDAVNRILADCVAWETAHPATTTKTLNLSGGTNGAPTGQGITDKATLVATGKWAVTTN